jgi:arabinose-5-phosphate isomerase
MIDILKEARQALEIEARGIQGLIPRLDESFRVAVQLMFDCTGKVVTTGMGKSGHVANKIAATLSSTGTPALYIHPGEASHGDLGMVRGTDVVLALSNSGESEEVLRLLSPLRRMGASIIAMTGNADSELARRADVHLDAAVDQEACPLGLAPTASTTAALALGDALAVVLLRMRDFTPENYALFHPGGSLGKKLMTTVSDVMDSGDKLPLASRDATLHEVIPVLQEKRWGLACIVDDSGRLVGSFSVGDLTRLHLNHKGTGFMDDPVHRHMNPNPKTVSPDLLAAKALHTMETNNIRALFAVDEANRPVGIIGLYEALRAIDY